MQIRLNAREANHPPDDGFASRYEELTVLPRQAFVRPDQDGKAAAVDEFELGEIDHEYLWQAFQRAADGAAQTLSGAQVKFALQEQHRPSPVVLGGDGQVGVGGHLWRFH